MSGNTNGQGITLATSNKQGSAATNSGGATPAATKSDKAKHGGQKTDPKAVEGKAATIGAVLPEPPRVSAEPSHADAVTDGDAIDVDVNVDDKLDQQDMDAQRLEGQQEPFSASETLSDMQRELGQLDESTKREALRSDSSSERTQTRLRRGDILRCVGFIYGGKSFNLRGRVEILDISGDVIVWLDDLQTFWPVRLNAITVDPEAAHGLGALVGTWSHDERAYPPLGADREFDKRFRPRGGKALMPGEKPTPMWEPPRDARPGHCWAQAKHTLRLRGFEESGAPRREWAIGQWGEFKISDVKEIKDAFTEVR